MSLEQSDEEAAAVAVARRVTLEDMKASIVRVQYLTGTDLNSMWSEGGNPSTVGQEQLDVMTLCILQVRNGFALIGKSAPASPENFDADLGKKFAYEDAVRPLWPLMGFALREELSSPPTVLGAMYSSGWTEDQIGAAMDARSLHS